MKPSPESNPVKTLDRVLSKAGLGSRTEARSWIHARRVSVNGRVVENPDFWINPDRDRILFDGEPVRPVGKRYVLLHKPTGYITTYKDPENRPTVYDLLGEQQGFLAPVGRLDLDSSGLLILTNDHQFAERLTNPEFHVPKTYAVKAAHPLTEEQVDSLRSGVELNDGLTRPAKVKRTGEGSLEITLTEGRNRQVRRMLEAVDNKVIDLMRIAIGPIGIGGLRPGQWRELNAEEVRRCTTKRSIT